MIRVDPHPALHLGAVEARYPAPLGALPSPAWLAALLRDEAPAPLARTETLRSAVRDLLRHGGYKPTGRGKPASEYLVSAAAAGSLGSINPAVDACNVVSLRSGLPISVVDLDRVVPPLSVTVVTGDERYVFNRTGQEIRLQGLLCLADAEGPCANAVKDSQRTKTSDSTEHTLSLVWAPLTHAEHLRVALGWYAELLRRLGARVMVAELDAAPGGSFDLSNPAPPWAQHAACAALRSPKRGGG